jgi:hypothetical protein
MADKHNATQQVRRTFLKATTAVAAPYFVSAKAMGSGAHVAPSEKITLGSSAWGRGVRTT